MSDETENQEFVDAIELMFFAYRDFIADSDIILERHGFGRAHHRVLHFVSRNVGISIAELLDILQITKQSLARVLRDLLDKGYIEQRIGSHDRRQRLLYPSERGRKLHGQLMAPQQKRFRHVQKEIGKPAFDDWKKTMLLVINRKERKNIDKPALARQSKQRG